MKKFSSVNNIKVNEPKKSENSKLENSEPLKYKILDLMDDFLKVQMYGPITRYHVAGTMKVVGKELFVEALMDLLSADSNNSTIKILESLKLETNDWETIDKAIDKIKDSKSKSVKKNKISNIFDRYNGDKELVIEKVKRNISTTSSKTSLIDNYNACQELINERKYNLEILSIISDLYLNKYQSL